MTHRFRFGVLAAVSSDPQAREDKASLPDQIQTARAAGQAQGGVETTEPFVLDGYSRTGYYNLTDALEDIPPLAEAIEAAQQNKYDVLIVDNLERLGDLAPMVYTLFKKHAKQIHSARQPSPIHDPRKYSPYDDETSGIMIAVEGIIQGYRINKIRRGWQLGVPARVDRGLHPLSLTYGYKLAGKNEPAEQVPEICALILRMKDMMLAGATYAELTRMAQDSGIPPPRSDRWHRQVVKQILLNPFYAGIVRFGAFRRRLPAPKSEWRTAEGKHKPLWDEATHRALLAEAKRRLEGKRNYASRYPFTGLTVCGTCGAKISKHGKAYEYLACKSFKHWSMRYEKAVPYLAGVVVDQFKRYQSAPHVPVDLSPLRAQLEDAQALRTRIQTGYEKGIYSDREAAAKIQAAEVRAEEIAEQIARLEQEERTWEERQRHREDVEIDELLLAVHEADPEVINHLLFELIEKIVLTPGDAVVVWR